MKSPIQQRKAIQDVLDGIVTDVRKSAPEIFAEARAAADKKGKPKPLKSDFDRFGIAIRTQDGEMISAGNARVRFPLQSISKAFALEVALEAIGEKLWERIGREPSGDPFNSIIDLERDKGVPRNPFINAGALVICDVLVGIGGSDGPNRHVVRFIERMLDESVDLHDEVIESARTGGDLNRSMMFMAKHHGNLDNPIEKIMDAYVHQCAIMVDCRGLAKAGRFLMHGIPGESTDRTRAATRRARRILATMMLCGLYDGAGDFAYRVGLPAKSGVGGGILAVSPNHASIAVWSPALDPMGNSWLGTLGLEMLTDRIDWSVFGRTAG